MKISQYVRIAVAVVFMAATTSLQASSVLIDFTTDDGGAPLVNGQHIETPGEFGNIVSITSGNDAAAIFDSTPAGPNAASSDQDLLVDLGNILIIQHFLSTTQTVPGIFDFPDDTTAGGSVFFDFAAPSSLESIDLIDIDGGNSAVVKLSDASGNMRTFNVPQTWTNDVRSALNGYATLDLTSIADQAGENAAVATATEDAGFDIASVVQLEVMFSGSGGLDNLRIVPEPTGVGMLAIASLLGLLGIRRRR